MSKAFDSTVYLFVCAARGIKPEADIEVSFDEVYKIAAEQNIWTVIYPLITDFSQRGKLLIPQNIKNNIESDFFRKYTFYHNRREYEKLLFEELRKENISFCLLKGDAVAQYYDEPLLRGSSDIDIKIAQEDIQSCVKILKKNGYSVEPLEEGHHHFECRHPVYGLLEVHLSFCMDITNDICFKNEITYEEEYREEDIGGLGKVQVLGYTDGFVFLIMHYIKHFISSGAGIRQLMDIIFYYEKNREHIDMDSVYARTEVWGYTEFVDIIFAIGKTCLMSDVTVSEAALEKVKPVMEDIEKGGVFGYVDVNRIDFYRSYLKLRADNLGVKMSERKRKPLIERIFPPANELEQRFSYLKKNRVLYPIAVFHNIGVILSARSRRRKLIKQAEETHIEQRLQMLRNVGLL